ncbi:MAG: hypothetical protein HGA66_17610 [Holophaga sp.]|nr:hypothetical protein [Holophaga sp.]
MPIPPILPNLDWKAVLESGKPHAGWVTPRTTPGGRETRREPRALVGTATRTEP